MPPLAFILCHDCIIILLLLLFAFVSQYISLFNMAIATAVLSLAFGVEIPETIAIMGGMTSTGRLVANPFWDKNDIEVLEKEGVKRLVVPSCAYAKLQEMINGQGGSGSSNSSSIELVPVTTMGDIVENILRPLYAAQPASSASSAPATATTTTATTVTTSTSASTATTSTTTTFSTSTSTTTTSNIQSQQQEQQRVLDIERNDEGDDDSEVEEDNDDEDDDGDDDDDDDWEGFESVLVRH